MKPIITSEQDIRAYKEALSSDIHLVHFKLVWVGPNTMQNAGYVGSNICDIATRQPGFFVISENVAGLREAMHDLVDRFCDIQEENYESKIQ